VNRQTKARGWNEVDDAKRDVQRAERQLSHRLEEAGLAGHATVERALSLVKPIVVGVVAVAGLAWLFSALRRPPRRILALPTPSRPTVFGEALRAASLALATTAARRLGEHWFAPEDAAPSMPAGPSRPALETNQ
jgi:hypothetical protein